MGGHWLDGKKRTDKPLASTGVFLVLQVIVGVGSGLLGIDLCVILRAIVLVCPEGVSKLK